MAAVVAALLVIVFAGLAPQTAQAEAHSQAGAEQTADRDLGGVPIMIVLDLSGSMNDDDGTGTVKLAGAKAALAEVARDIPPGTEVGLWTYPGSGQNSRDGCSLGDANYALGALDPARIAADIDLLTADGNTPTGPALGAAIDSMKEAGKTSGLVILVSDGLSNCGTPPCDVAKQARADGFDITAAVAGFQVSQEGREELECVANATGGVYVDASDSEELGKAVSVFVGPTLQVTTTGLDATLVGGSRQRVSVTLTNSSPALTAQGISVSLAFADAGTTSVFPAVLPPRAKLGNLPPGESRTYTWQLSVPVVAEQSVAEPRLTIQSATGIPSIFKGKWSIASDQLTLANAGPILRDATSVAIIGDSYSSGEGTFDYLPGSESPSNDCHKSLLTYGLVLFAQDGRLTNEDGSAVVACSGAVTQHYFQKKPAGLIEDALPPQQEQLGTLLGDPEQPPDLALMTFGGNDVGFADIIAQCAWPDGTDCTQFTLPQKPGVCLQRPGVDPSQGPLKIPEDTECSPEPVKFVDAKLREISTLDSTLAPLYAAVSARLNSPHLRAERGDKWAPLVVLGYPQILAENASCGNFNANERDFGIKLGAAINFEIQQAVNAAVDRRLPVYFAQDVSDAFVPDHTACAADDKRWVNPISVINSIPVVQSEQMHPNQSGYGAMTAALVTWSQSAEPLRGPFSLPPDAIRLDDGWLGQIGTSLNQLTVPDDPADVDMSAPSSDIYHQVAPEQPLHVTSSGLAPHSNVTVTLYSLPRTMGTLRADAEGRVDGFVAVPADAVRGTHEIVMTGMDPQGQLVTKSQGVVVVPPLPWWGWLVVASSLMALVLAGGLLWRRRRLQDAP